MGDIDFDELDKAVNNLMGRAPIVEDPEDPATKTLSISSTLQPGEKPTHSKVNTLVQNMSSDATQRSIVRDLQTLSLDGAAPDSAASPTPLAPPTPDPVSVPTVAPAPVVTAPVAIPAAPVAPAVSSTPVAPAVPAAPRPATGRFMDVMHSSSDMKTASMPALVVPDREGESTTVAPPLVVPDIPELPNIPTSVEQPVVDTPAIETAVTVPEPAFEFTSPIDTTVTAAPAEPVLSTGFELTEPTVPVVSADTAVPEISQPAEDALPLSPFLPDAIDKIEKRPLGTTPVAQTPELSGPIETPFESIVPPASFFTEDSLQGESQSKAEETPINGEFDKIATAGEKGEDQRLIDPTSITAVPTSEEKEVQSIESAVVAGADELQQETVQAIESGDTGHLSNGPGQQAADDEKTGDVFDVKNDNHPSIYPVKQKSGWLTVVIVVLVIAVCVGIAAAAYYIVGIGI